MLRLPDFLIIGAQKAGTTYLYNLLSRHPSVEVNPHLSGVEQKELHFFDTMKYQKRGLSWYLEQFPSSEGKLTGEATPYYLFCPRVSYRVSKAIPEAKLIVLLRDPVDRAFSDYQNKVREGNELLSFEEAIRAEPKRISGEREKMFEDETYYSKPLRRYSYIARGRYHEQIAEWFSYFAREQFLILKSEELFATPRVVYEQVLAFLGLEPHWPGQAYEMNAGDYLEKVQPDTEKRLRTYFEPHNRKLYELLEQDFGWGQ